MAFLRLFLALSRAAALPTVWSNCLAGWWLAGHARAGRLPLLLVGATALYLAGAFLNDAFDAGFDRQHRRARPLPTGLISETALWRWGAGLLVYGLVLLFCLGKTAGLLGLLLALCILVFNATHRLVTFSPLLLGLCRWLLYVVAGSFAPEGLTGWPVWCGLAMALYVTGALCFTSAATRTDAARYWPGVLLVMPIGLAFLMDTGAFRMPGLELSAVLLLWCLYCARPAWWTEEHELHRTGPGLLAGIVLVDWLAVADAPKGISVVLLVLFGATLLLQRFTSAS